MMNTKDPNLFRDSKNNINRRNFIGMASMGIGASLLPVLSRAEDESVKSSVHYFESGHQTPLTEDADVIVCGGGPAGIAAAISAARSGASVRLFEVHGCLGGVWTAGLLTWIYDFNKPGLTRELMVKLEERGARRGTDRSQFVYEPDEMKLLLEDLCTGAGVKIRLQTMVVAAHRDQRQLTTVITESKSGRQAWKAKVFIDATGDGDLGALAGCGWDIGQGKEQVCQPLTMNALAAVKDVTQLQKYISFYGGNSQMTSHVKAFNNFKSELSRAGIKPSYGNPTLFHVRDNVVLLMANHEYGVKPYDADALTAATIRSRKEVFAIARKLRELGGVWENFQIIATAEQIGIREGRRIHGLYTVKKEDLINGQKQEDGVAKVTFGVDIHAESRAVNDKITISNGGIKTLPYEIPLRALIARDVDGLMMAGRCISGDFTAHASYRVTGDAVAMGEASGVVAALASKSNRQPHQIKWSEAQAVLRTLSSFYS